MLQHQIILKRFIQNLTNMPDEELNAFLQETQLVHYKPKSFFTRIGQTPDRLGFVINGLFRVYYLSQTGEIHIRNFCQENSIIGLYGTILSGTPADVNIEALEKSVVIEFPFDAISKRYDTHPGWERLGRRVAEAHFVAREMRASHLLSLDAATRLQNFRNEFPELEKRITQANIAAYIGVKPETLSRLRKRELLERD